MQIKFGVIEDLYANTGADYQIVYWFDLRQRIIFKDRRRLLQVELRKQYGESNKIGATDTITRVSFRQR